MHKAEHKPHYFCLLIIISFLFISATSSVAYAANGKQHTNPKKQNAIAMHGDIKYSKNFTHFDYANPKAPKGGKIRLSGFGSFDSLNPFITKGTAADNITLLYDTLTTPSHDEAFTQYALIAESIEVAPDRSWVIFNINPHARFHDQHPITAEDVVFSFKLLTTQGAPQYRIYYSGVKDVQQLSKYRVKFNFKDTTNKELALIVGQLPILPKHFWLQKDFKKSTHQIPLGSGPYKILNFDMGRSIVYQRVDDYWAKDLPVNKGLYNFDQIHYDYFKDEVALLEALKAGEIDFRLENSSKQWATAYHSKAIKQSWLKKEAIEHSNPTGMQAFVMNLRNPLFQDLRVRQALNYAFDFEWTNKNIFYNAYSRTQSYFSNSELASSGTPSPQEQLLLKPFKEQLPATLFHSSFKLPQSDGRGYNRANLIKAKELLEQAGWAVKNNQLIRLSDGLAFEFEVLLISPAFERIVNPYAQALKKLGIKLNVRLVEVAQYVNRIQHRKFDMIVYTIPQSLSPGNEQLEYWHSKSADISSSRNIAGIKNHVVDQLVNDVISAPDRPSLLTRVHALDRVLLNNYYMIPQWHSKVHRIAYWDKFSRPKIAPKYDADYNASLMSWWFDPKKADDLKRRMEN